MPMHGYHSTKREVANNPKGYLQARFRCSGFDNFFMQRLLGDRECETAGHAVLRINGGNGVRITQNGYLYVYVSNTNEQHPVYFDNLKITHHRGALLEETSYYPFGLVMSGISSKALAFGGSENKYKFNGIEQNNDFDINMYDAQYRNLDPQIGRFWQIDPRPTDNISLYAAMNNNPIRYSDPLGDTIIVNRVRVGDVEKFSFEVVQIKVVGKLINESGTAFTDAQMKGFADKISSSVAESYSVMDGDAISVATADISVESSTNPLKSSDHAFRIVDNGKIPDGSGGFEPEGVVGKAPFGENVVYMAEKTMLRTEGPAGNGKTAGGLTVIGHNVPHELGHSANLRHPTPGTMDGNLMHQTIQPNAGKSLTGKQILEIEKAYKDGKLNNGKQKL